jgi:hypothetical protein
MRDMVGLYMLWGGEDVGFLYTGDMSGWGELQLSEILCLCYRWCYREMYEML